MARSVITPIELSGFAGSTSGTPAASYDAADATNDHEFTHPGGEALLYVINGSGVTLNVTVKAVASPRSLNMAEDKELAIGAGEHGVINIPSTGYDQGSGLVHVDIDQDTSSYLAVFRLKSI